MFSGPGAPPLSEPAGEVIAAYNVPWSPRTFLLQPGRALRSTVQTLKQVI
jgi:hypothetical protein